MEQQQSAAIAYQEEVNGARDEAAAAMERAAAAQSDCEALHAEVGDASPCCGAEDSERHAVGDVSAAVQAAVDAQSRGEKRLNMLELERAMCAVLVRAACRVRCVCCSVKSRRSRTATHERQRGLAVERACVRAARKVGYTQRAGAPVWCGTRQPRLRVRVVQRVAAAQGRAAGAPRQGRGQGRCGAYSKTSDSCVLLSVSVVQRSRISCDSGALIVS